jgi:hypothetical protein
MALLLDAIRAYPLIALIWLGGPVVGGVVGVYLGFDSLKARLHGGGGTGLGGLGL